jgi:hypothetical protein
MEHDSLSPRPQEAVICPCAEPVNLVQDRNQFLEYSF